MKKLIIISSHEYVRNYFETGAFSEIEDDNCYYLADKNIRPSEVLEQNKNFIGYISVSAKNERVYRWLFESYMWRYRDKSKAFYFRFYRQRIYHPKHTKNRRLKIIFAWLKSWKLFLSSNILTHKITVSLLESFLSINNDLERIINEIQPSLIIFPNSAYDSLGYEILQISEKKKINTLFLIDNWDNLSSKTLFWKKPNYMGVWGQQSKEHAITIQGFSEDKIKNLGTPRFQQYFDLSKESIPSHFSFPYILFCGSFLGFDELSALKRMDHFLEENNKKIGKYKLIYRPHPWRAPRECEDRFIESDYKNVLLDPQLKHDYYSTSEKLKLFQPKLNYYPALLKNAEFVVGPLTTMLIEALVCGTKVLALRYDDGIHVSSPHNAYKYYPHFKGIDVIKGLEFCDAKADLHKDYLKISNLEDIPVSDIHISLKHFIYHDDYKYCSRLKKIVDSCAQ